MIKVIVGAQGAEGAGRYRVRVKLSKPVARVAALCPGDLGGLQHETHATDVQQSVPTAQLAT